ncbi:hypothetical protein [Edwardsiella tarda]|uniref:hypothetical protein n=1 Tax=Edwardsiella tarda TaxID=636 RepID=UPI0015E7F691|nr:hypothetical protein DCF76_16765 [Edwardsiella tarda]
MKTPETNLKMKRILRRIPLIRELKTLKVLYSHAQLTRLEHEFETLYDEYRRLMSATPEVLAEFRENNPRVSSELHIQELISFKASRLKQELDWKAYCLQRAQKHVE